jgi:esterase
MRLPLPTGATLEFDTFGPDDAPAVVLIHGLSGNREGYGPTIDRLRERFGDAIRIVNVDLRGHGDSSHHPIETYEATSYAADIAALSTALGLGPALVVGHSLGGVTAAALAARHPHVVHSIFLEDPPLFEGDDERRAASPVASFFPMLVAAVRELQAASAPVLEFENLAATHSAPSETAERARSLQRWDPATIQAAIDGSVWKQFDPVAVIDCPITVLRADPAVGAVFETRDVDPLLDANPHAQIHLVRGASHSIHATATLDAYFGHLEVAVTEFLTSL